LNNCAGGPRLRQGLSYLSQCLKETLKEPQSLQN
jgi:hypothetical protein